MMQHVESMEGRVMFAAAPVPAGIAAAYDTLISSGKTFQGHYATFAAAIKADLKAIAADLKKLPKSKDNSALLATITKNATALDAGKTASGIKGYISKVTTAARKYETAVANFTAKPTGPNGSKLTAANDGLRALQDPYQVSSLRPAIEAGQLAAFNLQTALDSLAAAVTDPALQASITQMNSDLKTLGTPLIDEADTAAANIPALLAAD